MSSDAGPRPVPGLAASWRRAGVFVTPLIRGHWGAIFCGLCALVAVDLVQLWIPRLIKKAVDALESGVAPPLFLEKTGLLILVLAVAIGFLRYAWRLLLLGFSRRLETALRDRFYGHLLGMDPPFYQSHTVGGLMALATNDLASVQLAAGMGLVAALDALVMTGAALVFMAFIHPWLLVLALVPLPLLALATRILSGHLHIHFHRAQAGFDALTEFARQAIGNVRLVKACTLEESQVRHFDRIGREYIKENLRVARVQGLLFPAAGLVSQTGMLVVLAAGGWLVINARISIGDFTAFLAYLSMLSWPMMAMGWVTNLFQRGVTSLVRLEEVMLEEARLAEPDSPLALPPAITRIEIRGLSFSYDEKRPPVLVEVSCDLVPGIFGVVGRTGSGKSTLCRLLVRLYAVADGTVFWDGVDVNRLPLAALRRQIAYVPQESVLFSDTVAANIALGRPEATLEEIVRAARVAAIHDEILAFPAGYDSLVGERGLTLSGGQRQRIALARAILLDRPVMVIDDALAAVDTETERQVVANLVAALAGRIGVVVSHRVAPLIQAREIVVLEAGRVAARGTHEKLLRQSPYYAEIGRRQNVAVNPCPDGVPA